MEANGSAAALPYHEPGIVTILILTAFLLLLNVANHMFDKILYCGLLVEIFLGIAFGTPGGNLLGQDTERAIVNLGYLGLLLIVYEGGLLTSFKALKANIYLSIGVACTGIAVPIILSFVLLSLVGASALQAFAAGAALCSTSLGTTFTVMSASDLVATRMGVVLTSAAMMDDVVGLVMVQVISNLGTSAAKFSVVSVVRPVCVSLAFVVAIPLAARLIVKPLTSKVDRYRDGHPGSNASMLLAASKTPFILHTSILIALVTGAAYAGTSALFAAYLAGASVSWWDSEMAHSILSQHSAQQSRPARHVATVGTEQVSRTATIAARTRFQDRTGAAVFQKYYQQPLSRILKPFFFASIGFSVPITRMFAGDIVWKGIIYTLLMFIGKFVCGFWLIRLPNITSRVVGLCQRSPKSVSVALRQQSCARPDMHRQQEKSSKPSDTAAAMVPQPPNPNDSIVPSLATRESRPVANTTAKAKRPKLTRRDPSKTRATETPKPLSVYPGCIVGCAMVARGEIGFLISALAESNGVYGSEPNGTIFLVVTWAIMLCTIIGPLLVGLLVKRVKYLEQQGSNPSRVAVLGSWGVG